MDSKYVVNVVLEFSFHNTQVHVTRKEIKLIIIYFLL